MAFHPRTMMVRKAQLDIQIQLIETAEKHGLTYIETVQALAQAIDSISKDALRYERHPNSPDTPADVDE